MNEEIAMAIMCFILVSHEWQSSPCHKYVKIKDVTIK